MSISHLKSCDISTGSYARPKNELNNWLYPQAIDVLIKTQDQQLLFSHTTLIFLGEVLSPRFTESLVAFSFYSPD